MKNTTITEIKHFENSYEVLNEFKIEINLEDFIVEEYISELQSDISSTY